MEHFKNTEFVVIDVETTGLSPDYGDRVVEVAALKIRDLELVEHFTSLVNPGVSISTGAYMVNRITPEMLEGAPAIHDIIRELSVFIGEAYIIGHNVKFDLKFLRSEFELCKQPFPPSPGAFDTVRMARKLLPELRTYALRHVAAYLDVRIDGLHRAMADAHITFKIFNDLLSRGYKKDVRDVESLLKFCGFELTAKDPL